MDSLAAREAIRARIDAAARQRFDAWGGVEQGPFLNAVVLVVKIASILVFIAFAIFSVWARDSMTHGPAITTSRSPPISKSRKETR